MLNLIKNSDFRDSNSDGTPDLFTKIGSGGTLSVISGIIASKVGNALNILINDASGTGIYQNVLLEQNEDYVLSFVSLGGGSDLVVKVQEITSALAATGNMLISKVLRSGPLERIIIPFRFFNSDMAGVKISIYGKTVGVSDSFRLAYMQLEKGIIATDYMPSVYDFSDMLSETVSSKAVSKAGAQTIAGVKTFVSSPIVPTPTTDYQTATKKYFDDILLSIMVHDGEVITNNGLIIY